MDACPEYSEYELWRLTSVLLFQRPSGFVLQNAVNLSLQYPVVNTSYSSPDGTDNRISALK